MARVSSKHPSKLTPPTSPSKSRSPQKRIESNQPGESNFKRKSFRKTDNDNSFNEPPPKRNRSEAGEKSRGRNRDEEQPTTTEEGNTRRRRTLRLEEGPICTFCHDPQTPEMEPLLECCECKAKYHITKCLRYTGEIAENIKNLESWFCPRCVVCTVCDDFICDPSNVECSSCCRAWHGSCAPKGHCDSIEFNSPWFCSSCCKSRNIRVLADSPPRITKKSVTSGRKFRAVKEANMQFTGDIDELTDLINKRDYTWEFLNMEAGFTSKQPIAPTLNNSNRMDERDEDEFDYEHPDGQVPKVVAKDEKLFRDSYAEAYPQKPSSSAMPTDQYLHFGTGKACKAIYQSAYPEPLLSAPHLYACKFCLFTTNVKEDFVVHWDYCTARHPPGNEIYRDDVISFFEVDGNSQKKYCQNLCLLAKLFIFSKTLYQEVDTFIFYVLCEITTEGYVIVGYFSKEKNPSKNNNLSCLLVLPMVNKMGYGRLLIDMSYELSRREHRSGHPEHPLSDLGILAYRGYWRSSILCYLRENRDMEKIAIKDISFSTRITPLDVVNQMMVDKLVNFKNGTYGIKISKRALKFPLSQCRRRTIDPSKLLWKPKPEPGLDPTKLNSYI